MTIKSSKNAKIRLYDGTGTPYYLQLELDPGDFSAPIGAPRPEETLRLNRGSMDSYGHYTKGSDAKLMEPVNISFSVVVTDAALTGYILDWLAAMNDALATTVNSNTLVSTEADTQRDGSNNNPTFEDTNKGTSNVEYLIEQGETDRGWKYAEVYFPLDQISLSESEEAVTIAITGLCYGTITRITGFTAGTDVTA
jgi:hypothetical protein